MALGYQITIEVNEKEITTDSMKATINLLSEQLKVLGISHSIECTDIDSKMQLMKLCKMG